jgi:CYTH domain-containing protein
MSSPIVGKEVEVKYRLKYSGKLSVETNDVSCISQYYCDISNSELWKTVAEHYPKFSQSLDISKVAELRYRAKTTALGTTYTLTAKSTGDLSRLEVESVVDNRVESILNNFIINKPILKRRYCHKLPYGLIAEMDVFAYHLSDLVLIEVEFDPKIITESSVGELIKKHFATDSTSVIDVTNDKRYKNANFSKIAGLSELE